jgi:8-oxo-dGTP pyrophosphatase MutT (NUDIX family)
MPQNPITQLNFQFDESNPKLPFKPERRCVHTIIKNPKTNKFLVINNKATNSCSYYDYYLVGGGIEADEDYETCVRREIAEETGIPISEFSNIQYLAHGTQKFACPPFPELGYPATNKNLDNTVFYAETNSELDNYQEEETAKFQEYTEWVTFEELHNNILPGFNWVLENLESLVKSKIDV